MTAERTLAEFIQEFTYDQIPDDVVRHIKRLLLTIVGTGIAGASEEGCGELREMLVDRGGKPEATVMIFGDKLPATSAAQLNAVMCRALDYCDGMVPGIHIGSALIPAALAAAELRGGYSGREFITALVVGAEVGSRMNLTEEEYNGFDPTGVGTVYATTAVAARILELDKDQTLNALALAFNRCGGSFQSNVDGSLAVRLIEGWVAETGVTCALLAKRGLTGPANFISGVYGYLHLFARNKRDADTIVAGLGETYLLKEMLFKRYPSCGCTLGPTELALQACKEEKLKPELVVSAEIRLTPYAYRLVGHEFSLGSNPTVSAQFNTKFCIANALVRGGSELSHFRKDAVGDPEVLGLIDRIKVVCDPDLDRRGHITAAELTVVTNDGRTRTSRLDVAPGFPENPLNDIEHQSRFEDCLNYAEIPLPEDQANLLVSAIERLEELGDIRFLVRLLVAPTAKSATTSKERAVSRMG